MNLMLRKKKLIIIIVSIFMATIVIFALSIYVMSRLDTENYYFINYDDARYQGFTTDNWPKQVSQSAKEIHAQSQYDIYDVWMKFEIDEEAANKMVDHLRKLSDQEIAELYYRSPSYVDWWFNGFNLQDSKSTGVINADVFVDMNNCETSHTSKNAYIALDRDSPTVYYWCGS